MKNKLILCSFILTLLMILCFIVGTRFINYRIEHKSTENAIGKTESGNKTARQLDGTTFNEINAYVNKNGKSMLIIGKSGCTYCNMYLPVLRIASAEYGFEFMYADLTKLNDDDYKTLMNSEQIIIPAKCSDYAEDSQLKRGFGTPITLIFDNGKVYDCIRGYKDSSILYNTLIESKYIS